MCAITPSINDVKKTYQAWRRSFQKAQKACFMSDNVNLSSDFELINPDIHMAEWKSLEFICKSQPHHPSMKPHYMHFVPVQRAIFFSQGNNGCTWENKRENRGLITYNPICLREKWFLEQKHVFPCSTLQYLQQPLLGCNVEKNGISGLQLCMVCSLKH